jgi:hypothetical protein
MPARLYRLLTRPHALTIGEKKGLGEGRNKGLLLFCLIQFHYYQNSLAVQSPDFTLRTGAYGEDKKRNSNSPYTMSQRIDLMTKFSERLDGRIFQ